MPLESNREDGDSILLSVPAKCQALYQAPGQQHLAESSQLYEVGIVIPISPRREELKETEGPDRLSNCKVPALTLGPAFKGMRNSKQGRDVITSASLETISGDKSGGIERRRTGNSWKRGILFKSPKGGKKVPVNLVVVEGRM